jgi:hypothetical protein
MVSYYTDLHKARKRFRELQTIVAPLSPFVIDSMVEEIHELLSNDGEDASALDEGIVDKKSRRQMEYMLDAAKEEAHVGSARAKLEDLESMTTAYDSSTINLIVDEIHEHLSSANRKADALDKNDVNSAAQMERHIENVKADAHIFSAGTLLDMLETTEEKLSPEMVDDTVSEIYDHMEGADTDVSAIDPSGETGETDMLNRISRAAQRVKDLWDPAKMLQRQFREAVKTGNAPELTKMLKADPKLVELPMDDEGKVMPLDFVQTAKFDAEKPKTVEGRALAEKFQEAITVLRGANARTAAEVRRAAPAQARP